MRIKKLELKKFGPFRNYEVVFPDEDSICVLFTGKNNEGKSTIINALKLLDAGTRVVKQRKQAIQIDGEEVYRLLVQDTESLNIKRIVHNYEESVAEIKGTFADGFQITIFIDPGRNLIYADYLGRIPSDIRYIFGFIPALGPLSENEELLSKSSYIRANLGTSLAPRHLRNHLHQLLSRDEFDLIREIVNSSWEDIELLNCEMNYEENRLNCYYKEKRYTREIAWAGQGLQVWFQIITHLVRLRHASVLILDEPEINLHPEKQNDLIRILKEYFSGTIIIATHSIELMNNVHISHIVHVKKNQAKPKIKTTSDRAYLEVVRSQVGSNFNFIASQFEDVEIIIFTEDVSDFKIISNLAAAYEISRKAFNIPIHGFSEHKKAGAYKTAYELLIGRDVSYSILLDRDYYPEEYLLNITRELESYNIRVVYTPGKEIENLFLYPLLLKQLVHEEDQDVLEKELDGIYDRLYIECHGNYISLHNQFLEPRIDVKTVIEKYTPDFNRAWFDRNERHNIVSGKVAVKLLRSFFTERYKRNLADRFLVNQLPQTDIAEVRELVDRIYQVEGKLKQVIRRQTQRPPKD